LSIKKAIQTFIINFSLPKGKPNTGTILAFWIPK
jgi:hypothetical protein